MSSKLLVSEFAVSVSIMTYGAAKEGYWPWPAALARVAFAFAVLSILALANEKFAALLGAGFLLAQIMKSPVDANGNFRFTGGIPKGIKYGLIPLKGVVTSGKASPPLQTWTPGGAKLPSLAPSGNSNNGGGVVSV